MHLRLPRWWTIVLTSAFMFLFVYRATAANSANQLLQLSSDPYTNSAAEHQTEVEPAAFASGSTIVVAFQQGRFSAGGATDIGFARSGNSGLSWTNGSLPGLTTASGGTYASAT